MIWLSLFQTKLLILEMGMSPGTLSCADFEWEKIDLIVRDEHCHLTVLSFSSSVWRIELSLREVRLPLQSVVRC